MTITLLNKDVVALNNSLQEQWLYPLSASTNMRQGQDYLDIRLESDIKGKPRMRTARVVSLNYFIPGEPVVHRGRNIYRKNKTISINNGLSGIIDHIGMGTGRVGKLDRDSCAHSECEATGRHISVRYPTLQEPTRRYVYHENDTYGENRVDCYREDARSYDKVRLTHGYARTIHTAQGLERDTVFIHLGSSPYFSKRTLYTAITRAKHKVVIFARSKERVRQVCRKKTPKVISRLVELLRNGMNKRSRSDVPVVQKRTKAPRVR